MKIKKLLIAVLICVMTICVLPKIAFAADEPVQFSQDPTSSYTENDVFVDGVPKTIYCLQHDIEWPNMMGHENGATNFVKADPTDNFLTPDQLAVLTKVLFAGYPYNGAGCLDSIRDQVASWGIDKGDEYFEFACASLEAKATQGAIWYFTNKWNIKYNDSSFDDELVDPSIVQAYQALIAYAQSDAVVQEPSSSTVVISGSGELTEVSEGVWKTGALKIDQPAGYDIDFKITVPEGITVENAEGNTTTIIREGEAFYLTTEDPESIAEDAVITANATASYPVNVTWYTTTDRKMGSDSKPDAEQITLSTGGTAYMNKVQTMLCSDINSTDLEGTLSIFATTDDDEDITPGDPSDDDDEDITPEDPSDDDDEDITPEDPSDDDDEDITPEDPSDDDDEDVIIDDPNNGDDENGENTGNTDDSIHNEYPDVDNTLQSANGGNASDKANVPETESVDTSDHSNLFSYYLLMVLSSLGLLLLFLKQRINE